MNVKLVYLLKVTLELFSYSNISRMVRTLSDLSVWDLIIHCIMHRFSTSFDVNLVFCLLQDKVQYIHVYVVCMHCYEMIISLQLWLT